MYGNITFTLDDFTRPPQGMANNVVALLSNIITSLEVVKDETPSVLPAICMVKDVVKNGALQRTVDTAHLL